MMLTQVIGPDPAIIDLPIDQLLETGVRHLFLISAVDWTEKDAQSK